MQLFSDAALLLSVVNTYLRDKYDCLSDLCESEDVDEEELLARLSAAGYAYDEDKNQFLRS